MTVKEKIINNLVLLPENHATEIVNAYLPTINKEMQNTCSGYTFCWDCDSEYPDYGMYFYGLWNEMLAPIVLNWIDENMPQAWFRVIYEQIVSQTILDNKLQENEKNVI